MKKILHISKNGSGLLGTGIALAVNDAYTGEELYRNSVYPGNGLESENCYGIAIKYWSKILERFGTDIELDNSKWPELTMKFLNDGLNPQGHTIVVKRKWKDCNIEIYLNRYMSMPVYSRNFTLSLLQNDERIADIVRHLMKRYKNIKLDLSNAGSIKNFLQQ